MPKERVDLSKWTTEAFSKEYDLIKEKKSKLPYSQRQEVIKIVERKPEGEPNEIK